jgi:hypothetical protein
MTKDELIALAAERKITIDKRWGAKRIAAQLGEKADPVVSEPEPVPVREPAQSLANRIWAGQSPDLSRAERIRRIENALSNKAYDIEGIEYP